MSMSILFFFYVQQMSIFFKTYTPGFFPFKIFYFLFKFFSNFV